MRQPAQLGQLRQERERADRADPRGTAQHCLALLPQWARLHAALQLVGTRPQIGLQPLQMCLNRGTDRWGPGGSQPILLRGPQRHDLPTPLDQRGHLLPLGIWQRAGNRVQRLGAVCQDLRIAPVRLGQPSAGCGTVAHLAGGDHGHRQAGRAQFCHHGHVVPTRRLQHDDLRRQLLQLGDHLRDPAGVSAYLPLLPTGPYAAIQTGFCPLDPDHHC
jgi:hypothetical protein